METPTNHFCRNCTNLVDYPRNNSYGDMDPLRLATGYLTTGIDKDIEKKSKDIPMAGENSNADGRRKHE